MSRTVCRVLLAGLASETAKPRRRWLWAVIGVALLVFGGPAAWRFRPMSDRELRLVGTWKIVHKNEPRVTLVTFTRGRAFHSRDVTFPPRLPVPGSAGDADFGSWELSGNTLTGKSRQEIQWSWSTLLANIRLLLLNDGHRDTYLFEFDGPDCMRLTNPSSPNDISVFERLP